MTRIKAKYCKYLYENNLSFLDNTFFAIPKKYSKMLYLKRFINIQNIIKFSCEPIVLR